jgi:DNA-binding transcriptional MocR family regulator
MESQSVRNEEGTMLIGNVMATIKQRIAGRTLTPGAQLPSVRAFAKTMQVSKSTIVEAYERLAAEGIIRSRPGSGFYVIAPLAPLSLAEIGPQLDRAVDPLWISRQSLEAGDNILKPGCGWLPASWMPETALRRALRTLARSDDATLTDYGTPLGLPLLRQLLARRLGEHGIEVSPEHIMLMESGTQAIDLLCRFLLQPGDTVLVDDPCYFNFHALLRVHRGQGCRRPLYTVRTGHRSLCTGVSRTLTAPVHHEFRPSQSDRRDPLPRHRAPTAEDRRPVGGDHRRGRHLRRF